MLQHSSSGGKKSQPILINWQMNTYGWLIVAWAKDKTFNATMKSLIFDESIGNINIIPQDIGR
ncbi:MAG: hypothetical protein IPF69_06675 [Chitinophagaceae bacterium]|nr:hypothetical protein [Chitinophagaceae bacterium]